MPATRVEPFRIKYHSTELSTDVLSVKGYRGRCACGWVGTIRSHHSHARDDARRHYREERDALEATGGTEASDVA